MKKLFAALALLLALVMMLSLVACGGTKKKNNNVVDNNPGANNGNLNNDTSNGTNSDTNNDGIINGDNLINPPVEVTFEDRNEVVYALSPLNVRKTADFTNGEIIGGLKLGQGVTRIGYHVDYSKILFDHDSDETTDPIEAYVGTKYVTTDNVSDADFTILETPDTFYCSSAALNVRALPHHEATVVGYLAQGDAVTRISYGTKWAKISYTTTTEVEGETKEVTVTGYVNFNYLTAENPNPVQ